jgi:hypothetical protein
MVIAASLIITLLSAFDTNPFDAAALPRLCDGPPYRLLDFWVGEWNVYLPDGRKAGTNSIEKTLDGCAILEHWQGTAGGNGKSLFYFDTARSVWKQVWVTDSAAIKEQQLIDQLPGGTLRFQGALRGADGGTILDRTTAHTAR